MNAVHVVSYIMRCDVMKCGCDALYRVCDVIHIVGLMSFKQRVCYHQTSGCDDKDTVALMSYTRDMMS